MLYISVVGSAYTFTQYFLNEGLYTVEELFLHLVIIRLSSLVIAHHLLSDFRVFD